MNLNKNFLEKSISLVLCLIISLNLEAQTFHEGDLINRIGSFCMCL